MVIVIKRSAFVLFTLVSGYLSVNMFINLGADLAGRIILGFVSISLESAKVFALLRIEYALFLRSKESSHKYPYSSLVMYTALALLSVIASLGFTLETVDRQVETTKVLFTDTTEDYTFNIEQLQSSLNLIDAQIATMQKQLSNINPDYATGTVKLSTEATNLLNKRAALIEEISALKKQQHELITQTAMHSEKQNVYGMFVLMGNIIGVSEKDVMTFLLLLISVLLEIGMIYTSPTIRIPDEVAHEVVHKASPIKKSAPKPRQKTAKIPVAPTEKSATTVSPKTQITVQPNPPNITTTIRVPERPSIDAEIKAFLQKLLHPVKDTELKSAASLSAELQIPVETINDIFHQIGQLRGPNGPLIIQKNAAWHLNYMKELAISIILRSPRIMHLLRGVLHVSKIK